MFFFALSHVRQVVSNLKWSVVNVTHLYAGTGDIEQLPVSSDRFGNPVCNQSSCSHHK